MVNKTQLQVEAINNGSVIDHIPANIGIKVLKLFKMHKSNQRITIGLNLPSSALGAKDLIKIENELNLKITNRLFDSWKALLISFPTIQ